MWSCNRRRRITNNCCSNCCCNHGCSNSSHTTVFTPKTSVGGGFQAQLEIPNEDTCIADNATVVFNNILNHSHPNISYDANTGEFIINKASTYYIHWNVTFDGTDLYPYVIFGLEVNGEPYGISSIPIVIGAISDSSLITVTKTPTRILLKNMSGNIVSFTSINPVANIVIVDLNKE